MQRGLQVPTLLALALLALLAVAGAAPLSRIARAMTATEGTAAYGLAVQAGDQDFIPGADAARPPVGSRWVLVIATVQNLEGETVMVSAESLVLVDQRGRRYRPASLPADIEPALVGTTLARGDWATGLSLFEPPREAIGEWLEWCPIGPPDCAVPVRSPVPITPSGVGG